MNSMRLGGLICAAGLIACSTMASGADWRDLYALGVAAQRELDYESAESKLLLALDAAKGAEAEPAEVGRILDRLGTVYFNSQRDEQAEEVLRESLDLKSQALGEEHPAIAATLLPLAEIHFARRRYGEAESLLERAVELRRLAWPANSPALAEALVILGSFQEGRGSLAAAETSFRRAVEAVETCETPPRQLADGLLGLERTLRAQGREGEAEALRARIENVLPVLLVETPADAPATCRSRAPAAEERVP